MLRIIEDGEGREGKASSISLDELVREGARLILHLALQAEVETYLEEHRSERDERGHALVTRNGTAKPRQVTVGCGVVEVKAPRVRDRRVDEEGKPLRFTSKILPPYMRRSPKVAEVLPVLYLRGLSTSDFREALPVLLGDRAKGLSPTTITRLTADWEREYQAWRGRDLSDRDYVYVWVDGVHFNIRLEEDRLCTLVMIGARPDGTKELLAVEDGYRESTESWRTVLRSLKARGMQAPMVAVGDGALGFWNAVRDVWPETREQRDWVHKIGNVIDKLPKRLQPKAKRALRDIMQAETRAQAKELIKEFSEEYKAKYPRAVKALVKDETALLTHFDFPADHWRHLRTTNVIESVFATVRLRQRVTKGAGSRTRGLVMAYKLLDMAQKRWRRITEAKLLPLVRQGARIVDGVIYERTEQKKGRKNAA